MRFPDSYSNAGIASADVFEEIPVTIHNPHLVHAFLFEMREAGVPKPVSAAESGTYAAEFERLAIGDHAVTTKSLALMADAIEEIAKDQTTFSQYLRNASRQHAQQQAFLAKRVRD